MKEGADLNDFGDVLLTKDVEKLLRISRNTVSKLLKSGEIQFFRVGKSYRIPKKSIESYINSTK